MKKTVTNHIDAPDVPEDRQLQPEQYIEQLQQQNEQLAQQKDQLQMQADQLAANVKWFEEQLRLSRQQKFGVSSEKTEQLQLFNEPESEAEPIREEPSIETVTYQRKKAVGQRAAMLKDLPVEVVEYDLPEQDQICPRCSGALHAMSTEVRQELKIIPAEVKVVKHVRHVYSCRQCEREGTETPVITAPMPDSAAPGSLASPSILAYIMSQKYVEAMPL